MDEYVSMLHAGLDPHKRLIELAQNKEVHPWDSICCKECYYATESKCVCHCGGLHHGKGSSDLESHGLEEWNQE